MFHSHQRTNTSLAAEIDNGDFIHAKYEEKQGNQTIREATKNEKVGKQISNSAFSTSVFNSFYKLRHPIILPP